MDYKQILAYLIAFAISILSVCLLKKKTNNKFILVAVALFTCTLHFLILRILLGNLGDITEPYFWKCAIIPFYLEILGLTSLVQAISQYSWNSWMLPIVIRDAGMIVLEVIWVTVILMGKKGDTAVKEKSIKKSHKKAESTDDLIKYKQLLDSGAITEDEYEMKKKEILNLQ